MIRITGVVFIAVFFFIANTEGSDGIVVIVNKKNTITEISQSDLVKIYMGRKSFFDNNAKIIPLDLNEKDSLRIRFYENILDKDVHKIKSYWIKRIFSGSGYPPIVFKRIEDIKRYVAENEGAIGYINKSSIDESIKILNVVSN